MKFLILVTPIFFLSFQQSLANDFLGECTSGKEFLTVTFFDKYQDIEFKGSPVIFVEISENNEPPKQHLATAMMLGRANRRLDNISNFIELYEYQDSAEVDFVSTGQTITWMNLRAHRFNKTDGQSLALNCNLAF